MTLVWGPTSSSAQELLLALYSGFIPGNLRRPSVVLENSVGASHIKGKFFIAHIFSPVPRLIIFLALHYNAKK